MKKALSILLSVVMLLGVTAGMDISALADDKVVLDAVYLTVPEPVIGERAEPFVTTTTTVPAGYGVDASLKWYEHTTNNFYDDCTLLGEDDIFQEGYWYEFNGDSWYDTGSAMVKAGYTKYYVNGVLWTTAGNDIAIAPVKKLCIHQYKDYVTKATTAKNGKITNKCPKCDDIKSTKAISYPKTITISTTTYTYDGKVKKPSVTVKGADGKVIPASNYTITYPSGRKNVGKYAYKITFKGNYSGSVSKTFVVNPKNTSGLALTATKKGFKASWKKYATQTTGYQIQYATDSKFTKGVKTVTVSKNSTTSQSVTKLTAKKKYYVRVRTYKTVSGTKYYSSWSASKAVTTKK